MHRILQTLNSDYYMINDTCVAVRDRSNQSWSRAHSAVGARLIGSIRMDGPIAFIPAAVHIKGRLVFSNDVMTSPVRAIAEPTADALLAA